MRRIAVALLVLAAGCGQAGTYSDPTPQPTLEPTPRPTVAPSASPDGSPVTTADTSAVVLGSSDLGVIKLGVSLTSTRAALERHLGEPDETKTVSSGQTEWGVCGGETGKSSVTGVRWATLWVLFSDESGEMRSFTYLDSQHLIDKKAKNPHRLKTDEGISRGSTVSDLSSAYGSKLIVADEEPFGPIWNVSSDPDYLGGTLTGTKSSDKVVSIEGGKPCGE